MRVDFIDLSHWNGYQNLSAAKRHGVKAVWHKVTEGNSNWKDNRYEIVKNQCASLGLPFGAYHFARPYIGSAHAEAERLLAMSEPARGDLRPMLDWETNKNRLNKQQRTNWLEIFAADIKEATGVSPIVYTKYSFYHNFDCPLWVARYSNSNRKPRKPSPWKHYTFWQFSNGKYGNPHTFSGLNGYVDLNYVNSKHPQRVIDSFILGREDADMPLTDADCDKLIKRLMHSRWDVKPYDTDKGAKDGKRELQEFIRSNHANINRTLKQARSAPRRTWNIDMIDPGRWGTKKNKTWRAKSVLHFLMNHTNSPENIAEQVVNKLGNGNISYETVKAAVEEVFIKGAGND